jgi:hypothetical protein
MGDNLETTIEATKSIGTLSLGIAGFFYARPTFERISENGRYGNPIDVGIETFNSAVLHASIFSMPFSFFMVYVAGNLEKHFLGSNEILNHVFYNNQHPLLTISAPAMTNTLSGIYEFFHLCNEETKMRNGDKKILAKPEINVLG